MRRRAAVGWRGMISGNGVLGLLASNRLCGFDDGAWVKWRELGAIAEAGGLVGGEVGSPLFGIVPDDEVCSNSQWVYCWPRRIHQSS